jgi:hypothetical protein
MAWPLEATVISTNDDIPSLGYVCTLPIEKAVAKNMLDDTHVTKRAKVVMTSFHRPIAQACSINHSPGTPNIKGF